MIRCKFAVPKILDKLRHQKSNARVKTSHWERTIEIGRNIAHKVLKTVKKYENKPVVFINRQRKTNTSIQAPRKSLAWGVHGGSDFIWRYSKFSIWTEEYELGFWIL